VVSRRRAPAHANRVGSRWRALLVCTGFQAGLEHCPPLHILRNISRARGGKRESRARCLGLQGRCVPTLHALTAESEGAPQTLLTEARADFTELHSRAVQKRGRDAVSWSGDAICASLRPFVASLRRNPRSPTETQRASFWQGPYLCGPGPRRIEPWQAQSLLWSDVHLNCSPHMQ
jgi:hypothetical protein